MTFRTRMLLVFAPLMVLPVALFAFGIRRTVERRLTDQYEAGVAATVLVVEEDLAGENAWIGSRLDALAADLADDNRFRAAVLSRSGDDRSWLLDRAGEAMRLAGLSVLQIQDDQGRILSSGHFRNDYDRLDPALPAAIVGAPGGFALAEFRTPDGSRLALARTIRLRLGVESVAIVGGVEVDPAFLRRLGRGGDPAVRLEYPDGAIAGDSRRTGAVAPPTPGNGAGDAVTRALAIPYVGGGAIEPGEARFVVRQSLEPLNALRRSIDAWFIGGVVLMAILALVLATWASARVSRPLAELARRTARLDLDALDVDFSTRRTDEIGKLSRLLGAMTDRMRGSVARLRDAERRATVGDLARQVNHDVRNGLTPIRNVVRHLSEVAKESPGEFRYTRLHEPGAGGAFAEGRGHPRRCLRAGGPALRVAGGCAAVRPARHHQLSGHPAPDPRSGSTATEPAAGFPRQRHGRAGR
jgi:HAMP domain-containing protein